MLNTCYYIVASTYCLDTILAYGTSQHRPLDVLLLLLLHVRQPSHSRLPRCIPRHPTLKGLRLTVLADEPSYN